ncbi:HlyD family type I secretion periplasmic adaptor subunit [Amorphus orientalis]|uniref:Membrane fusion protein (MFP) family protein n=1 Tax=Amorphus orientalis TaxID=649198 RepID=A0AAE3VPJ6_9HYPH|nr:HlyD family type I secretion periplasmic adaptor subunit [Amorphus orientalis]MDQ0315949.1 HlyD family secretion protein [Amorphus orientalis]
MSERDGFRKIGGRLRHDLLIGGLVCGFMVVGVGGWAAMAKLGGAVIAPGQVVVSSSVKTVQHKDGGIVGRIFVENGDTVAAGDLLIQLDATSARARRAILDAELIALQSRWARLDAEREDRDALVIPHRLTDRLTEPAVETAIAGERRVLAARLATLAGQLDMLEERKDQFGEEIEGLKAQLDAKELEIELIADELGGLRSLLAQGHVPKTRVMALERNKARLEGERGELVARIAVVKGRIAETEIEALQLKRDAREKALAEIRDVETKIADLSERLVAAEDDLARIDVRAPAAGMVHELAVHTEGGVVGGGEPILQIVPDNDRLVIDVMIPPTDIEQVHLGQPAVVSLNAFDMRETPQLEGTVTRISPDLSRDEHTDATYYSARVSLSTEELDRLKGAELVPGMPAEVFIQTRERTVMTYLLEPLQAQMRRTFRDS